jgi:serine protease Do
MRVLPVSIPCEAGGQQQADFDRKASFARTSTFGSLISSWVLALLFVNQSAIAQPLSFSSSLPRSRYLDGTETLRAFIPISEPMIHSVVRLSVDGSMAVLGTVMDTNGLVLTKASELKNGKLTCWLSDKEVPAELLATDGENDLALVRVHAEGLKPVPWSEEEVTIGQWAITPGVTEAPSAVGIVSTMPRRIRPKRALIGVQFDFNDAVPKIDQILTGLGAEKAGIKPGDVIIALNGTNVNSREEVSNILREFREGQSVKVRVQRGETQVEASITLMPPPAEPPSRLASSRQQRLNRVIGDVSQRAEGFDRVIEHDTILQPWLCGGPLLNLDGKAIGLNIARAGRVTTYALPADLVEHAFERLNSSLASTNASRL